MSHKKFGPDRFSRFDVYWIQANKNKQTDKQIIYIKKTFRKIILYYAFRRFAPIFFFNFEHVFFVYIVKWKNKQKIRGFYINFVDFQKFFKSNFVRGTFLKVESSKSFPCGHTMSHKQCGHDRFSHFDVYWIQTNKQTDRLAQFIFRLAFFVFNTRSSIIFLSRFL